MIKVRNGLGGGVEWRTSGPCGGMFAFLPFRLTVLREAEEGSVVGGRADVTLGCPAALDP